MKTYQDLIAVGENDKARMEFLHNAIADHKNSALYKTAVIAKEYDARRNVTITNYQKLLYTLTGKAVPDNYSANHKVPSNYFNRFVTQQTQYLLGNGVQLTEETNKEKLGKKFDNAVKEVARNSIVCGVAFGFWNFDHVEHFQITEFVPLYDEETGAMKAGIRFWQIADDKPLRITLYEIDGYTEYIKRKDEDTKILKEKQKYIQIYQTSEADGMQIVDGRNYKGFPIIPMWANRYKQSAIVGMREAIDCFDLIKSGFANDLDDASMIYWTITNAGGMDDVDLAKFLQHIKTVKAAVVDEDGAKAEAHTMDIPYESRVAYLDRLDHDLYNDSQMVNVADIAAGNITATAIKASYVPMDNLVDDFEYYVIEFLLDLFEIAGIDDYPSFVRSRIDNQLEITQMLMTASPVLDDETIVRKLPFLTPEEADEVLKRIASESMTRLPNAPVGGGNE